MTRKTEMENTINFNLGNKGVYSKDEILSLMMDEESVSEYNKDKKIKELCEQNKIYAYSKGKYKPTNSKIKWEIIEDKKIDKLLDTINYDGKLNIGYFDTSFFNRLTSLQTTKNHIIICCEGFAEEALMHRLTKISKSAIDSSSYTKLMKQLMNFDFDFDFIIKKITVDTPFLKDKSKKYITPTLEALLVDALSDKYLKQIFSSEFDNIYRNALMTYEVKMDRLLRYAHKKHIYDEVERLLEDINFDIEIGEFYDRCRKNARK